MRVVCHIPNDDLRKAEVAARAAEAVGFGGLVALIPSLMGGTHIAYFELNSYNEAARQEGHP